VRHFATLDASNTCSTRSFEVVIRQSFTAGSKITTAFPISAAQASPFGCQIGWTFLFPSQVAQYFSRNYLDKD
jgi:hypothetical protein